MVLREVDVGPTSSASMANAGEGYRHRHGRPSLRFKCFKQNIPDKCVELLSFEMEVMNILQTTIFELNHQKKVCITKNWLGREGLQLNQTFTNYEKKGMQNSRRTVCNTKRFKPQHNETTLLVQYCKLKRKSEESPTGVDGQTTNLGNRK